MLILLHLQNSFFFVPPASKVCKLLRSPSYVKQEENLSTSSMYVSCWEHCGGRVDPRDCTSARVCVCVFAELLVSNVMIPGSLAPAC